MPRSGVATAQTQKEEAIGDVFLSDASGLQVEKAWQVPEVWHDTPA